MKISRFLKTIFMTDFEVDYLLLLKKFLNQKKLLITHLKKEKLVHDLEVSMH